MINIIPATTKPLLFIPLGSIFIAVGSIINLAFTYSYSWAPYIALILYEELYVQVEHMFSASKSYIVRLSIAISSGLEDWLSKQAYEQVSFRS